MSYDIHKNLKSIRRDEHIPASSDQRAPQGSMQWFLENRSDTHPIHNNNALQFFMCGKEGFGSIAGDIDKASYSVDLVCWGFDPAMELVRKPGKWGQRGETFGDLLARKSKQGVKIRLLIWKDLIGSTKQGNMIGYISPSLWHTPDGLEKQRLDHCIAWWKAIRYGDYPNIEIRTRSVPSSDARHSLAKNFPDMPSTLIEKLLTEEVATHHQKPVLIDYEHPDPSRAVGYVMGLNSITDYWDSSSHIFNDHRREADYLQDRAGSVIRKPYRDYAIRVQGEALYSLNQNFSKAWDDVKTELGKPLVNGALLGSRAKVSAASLSSSCTVGHRCQIVRTQPQEQDATIWESYQLALSNAIQYIYAENQYFFLPEWAQGIKQIRKANQTGYQDGKVVKKDIPVLYVFIVIPNPEERGMVPRTYTTVAELGAGNQFPAYQTETERVAKEINNPPPPSMNYFDGDVAAIASPGPKDIVDNHHLSDIKSIRRELQQLGIEVLVAMLQSFDDSGSSKSKNSEERYREIYIHSKLMLIDDTFTTLGSANLSPRSMAGDSELNLITEDPGFTSNARSRVWGNLAGGDLSGGGGSRDEIAKAHKKWKDRMDKNYGGKSNSQAFEKGSFVVPFRDTGGSAMRVR